MKERENWENVEILVDFFFGVSRMELAADYGLEWWHGGEIGHRHHQRGRFLSVFWAFRAVVDWHIFF